MEPDVCVWGGGREEMERLPYKGGLLYLLDRSMDIGHDGSFSKGHDGIIRQNTSCGLANFFQFFWGGGGGRGRVPFEITNTTYRKENGLELSVILADATWDIISPSPTYVLRWVHRPDLVSFP